MLWIKLGGGLLVGISMPTIVMLVLALANGAAFGFMVRTGELPILSAIALAMTGASAVFAVIAFIALYAYASRR